MKFEIKNRWSGALIFSIETDNWRLAIEAAIKSKTNLSSANLSSADLRSANLRSADLSSADLSFANLSFANLSFEEKELKLVGGRPYFCIGPIGSRTDYLQAFVTDQGVFIRAGCFWNSLKEFKKAIKATHADNEHAKEYAIAVKLIEFHAKQYGAK